MKTAIKERKVFISFLGASNYSECHYMINGQLSRPVRYVQEAMLEHYASSGWDDGDCAYIMLTDIAKARNWENDGHKTKEGEVIKQQGLRDCLAALELPMNIVPVENVPMGNDEKEIMSIFSTIFGLLQEGDELYFDITHGFRYLPMITLVLGNYSKFLKNVTVRWIGYGNFEGRNQATNVAQVVDLTSMSMLQDWTTAAADFINNGNASEMVRLTSSQDDDKAKDMAESLNAVVDDIKTCRGMNIHNATNVKELNIRLGNLKKDNNEISLMTPVIEKIRQNIAGFDIKNENNIRNGFEAVRWCIKHNMTLQAATILVESVLTFICQNNDIDIKNEYKRDSASKAIFLFNIPQDEWKCDDHERERIKSIIDNDELVKNEDFRRDYKDLTRMLRNDLCHNGMRRTPSTTHDIKVFLEQNFTKFYHYIIESKIHSQ